MSPRVDVLTGAAPHRAAAPSLLVREADAAGVTAHRALRRSAFVHDQGLFAGSDTDDLDDDPATVVLVATGADGGVLGGVRLAPAPQGPTPQGPTPQGPAPRARRDIGWWCGSRLVVAPSAPGRAQVAAALVRAACARAEAAGALRFEATVQARHEALFTRLGWQRVRPVVLGPAQGLTRVEDHVLVRWPIGRIQALATATKAPLGQLLAPLLGAGAGVPSRLRPGGAGLGGPGWVGDDGAPVPGSDLVAACDAILPSLVERDPEWAGWCSVLVNLGDLGAMGAEPVGLLDALGARDASFATRVLRGLARAADAWGVPVLGGHTQLGVPASLAVTALGRTTHPVPAGGGRAGHALTVTADLGGAWRERYRGAQWDSTTGRTREELRTMGSLVARTRPAAAKDVSMAGLVGTVGMLAEASGCAAVLDVAAVPTPAGASTGDWLTCFPGLAMVTADDPGRGVADAGPATSAPCGHLAPGSGVLLRWPDGECTRALTGAVTGLGAA